MSKIKLKKEKENGKKNMRKENMEVKNCEQHKLWLKKISINKYY